MPVLIFRPTVRVETLIPKDVPRDLETRRHLARSLRAAASLVLSIGEEHVSRTEAAPGSSLDVLVVTLTPPPEPREESPEQRRWKVETAMRHVLNPKQEPSE